MKKKKTNHDLVARVFPRFRPFDCFYSKFPLALKGIFLSSERPLLFLWFWFHNTRSKSALLSKSLMYNVGARHSHKRDMIVGGNCTYSWNLISQHGIIRTANKNKERNQKIIWEFRVKTSKLLKARENAGDQVLISFSFPFDWIGTSFLDQSQIEEKKNQSNPRLLLPYL